MKRRLKVQESVASFGFDVVNEGGDKVAHFALQADATLFANSDALLDAARNAYTVLLMPLTNSRTKHYVGTDLNMAIARAEGKCP